MPGIGADTDAQKFSIILCRQFAQQARQSRFPATLSQARRAIAAEAKSNVRKALSLSLSLAIDFCRSFPFFPVSITLVMKVDRKRILSMRMKATIRRARARTTATTQATSKNPMLRSEDRRGRSSAEGRRLRRKKQAQRQRRRRSWLFP